MQIDEPERLPLVPESILRSHKVHFPSDTRYRACARLKQAIWREEQGVPMGVAIDAASRKQKYGHLISAEAAAAGGNFLTPVIQRVVFKELRYREPGALIDDNRVYRNLLASMPLAFNLFGALKADNNLAEAWVAECFPDLAGKVSNVAFEHSPGRGDSRFTEDGTAFDVLISIRKPDGAKVFLALEIKFTEGMSEPEPRMRPRYDDLSVSSGLYRDAEDPALRRNPLQQIWRQHLLAQSMVQSGLYDTGRVVLIAPSLNNEVQRAAIRYRETLAPSADVVGFQNLTLEQAIGAVALAGDAEHARALSQRYLDFTPVHALI